MSKYKQTKDGYFYIDKRIGGERCHLTGKTCAELDRKFSAWVKENRERQKGKGKSPKFETVAAQYRSEIAGRLKHGTYASYLPRIDDAVNAFGEYRMDEIQPYMVTALYREMLRRRARGTVEIERCILNGIFQCWIDSPEWRGGMNPVKLATMPKGGKVTERVPPTADQIAAVKAHPKGFGFVPNFFMYTGLRMAEANGLQKKDIALERDVYGIKGCISVSKSARWIGNKAELTSTKNDSSVRLVPVFAPLRPMLEEWLRELKAEDYVLSRRGEPYSRSEFRRAWTEYFDALGYGRQRPGRQGREAVITPHQFRHEFATTCYEAGVPVMAAAKMLGHSDAKTTERIYTHLRERILAESVGAMEMFYQENTKD